MIKCSHLTPKSIYSNIGDLVADPLLDEVLLFLSSCFVLSLVFKFSCVFKKNFI